jgi:hypothetical protein
VARGSQCDEVRQGEPTRSIAEGKEQRQPHLPVG